MLTRLEQLPVSVSASSGAQAARKTTATTRPKDLAERHLPMTAHMLDLSADFGTKLTSVSSWDFLLKPLEMLKGFNSDIRIRGESLHVQTEDWGVRNPYLVSQIFRSGAIVKVVKIPYTKVLPSGVESQIEEIHAALEAQHNSILDLLLSGQLSLE